MDVTSYLLGKNASGGGGADLSKYFKNQITKGTSSSSGVAKMIKTIPSDTVISGTDIDYAFIGASGLVELPVLDTSNVETMAYLCKNCSNLISFPLWNTSKVFNMTQMFYGCSKLENVSLLDTRSITNFAQMFYNCSKLTDASLNNILKMCVDATSYSGTKTLSALGITNSTVYPASRIQALSNYQDFVNAGWTIS